MATEEWKSIGWGVLVGRPQRSGVGENGRKAGGPGLGPHTSPGAWQIPTPRAGLSALSLSRADPSIQPLMACPKTIYCNHDFPSLLPWEGSGQQLRWTSVLDYGPLLAGPASKDTAWKAMLTIFHFEDNEIWLLAKQASTIGKANSSLPVRVSGWA